ncbi:MAG: T9SS type A sorting domain-containing protein [Ignavibacteriaceae bacterium]|nr:T9SS type A sorting domain-containing protein [Ignavibacteriaceae bacterium]
MKTTKLLFPFAITIASFIFSVYLFNDFEKPKPVKTSGALASLQMWTNQRAYPFDDILGQAYYKAYTSAKLNKNNSIEGMTDGWKSIGPHNIGGRTIAIEINPQNPSTIFAGAASGGLWRSFTEGKGAMAWERITTGYPVKSVGAIAINPTDTNIIYIGTGEVYGYQQSTGGVTVRATRGSYGIGILKTTNGGAAWSKSLDWTQDQRRGVEVIKLNPLNPNSIWAGTSEGTMRSLDGGKTWITVNNTIMVTDIIINPLDTNQVVIACGNLSSIGTGIYRSSNYGNSWVKITAGLPSNYGGKVLFNVYRANPNLIYASIGFGDYTGAGTNLCKSTNFGSTWAVVSTIDYATYQGWFAHFVGVHPFDSSIVLTAGVDVFKSTDGGSNSIRKSYWFNWFFGVTQPGEPEGPPDYSHADHHAIAWHPTNPNVVYFGNDGGIFCTTDAGETFEGRNGGYQTQQFYNGFSASLDDSLLAMGGLQDNGSAIFQGTNAWRRVIGGDGAWTAIDQTNNSILYGSSQYGNINKSTNGGVSFFYAAPNDNGEAGFVAPYVISYANHQTLYAGRTNIFKTTNGAQAWVKINSQTLDNNPFLAMALPIFNDNVVYAATAPVRSRGKVFVSTNGGVNWTNITGSLPDRYPMDIVVDPVDEAKAYIVFSGFETSHIFKTTDYGQTWHDVGTGLPDVPTNAVAVDYDFPDHVYVGNDLGVYLSTDGGLNWNSYSDGLPEAVIVMDLAMSPSNSSIKVATHGNGAYERKLYSTVTVVEQIANTVKGFRLEQNYPNPFNTVTKIKFIIPQITNHHPLANESIVNLKVYDELGSEIVTLVDEYKPAGNYEVNFNASRLSSGVYFYKLTVGKYSETKKMVILK